MLTSSVKKMFTQARKDKTFQAELIQHEPEYYKISRLSDEKLKIIYASVYMGWLIAKGLYNEKDFE